jgi:drug/metabolite transporter (DMT)-like permease
MTSPGLKPYFHILTACVWFSAMGLCTHELGRHGCHWLVVAAARSGLAALIAIAAALALGIPLVLFKPRMLWVRSLSGSCSMLCTFYALATIPVTDVLTLTNTFPVWVAVLSWPLAGERPTAGVWLAVVFSVAGVAVALNPAGESFQPLPSITSLAAAFFTAVAMLGLNRLKGVNPLAVVVHFSAVSTFACLAVLGVMLAFDLTQVDVSKFQLSQYLLLLAVGATAAVGQIFLTWAYAGGSPTKVSVVGLSQVLMVMAVEASIGRKVITHETILGTAMVLGPVAWLMARERRPPKAANEIELEEVAIE